MAQEQVVHVILHGANGIRSLEFGIGRSLFQADQAAIHAYRIIAHDIAKSLVDRKFHLRIEGIVRRFIGLGFFFGFFRQALACRHFFAHAAQIGRELGIAGIQFARCILVFFGQLGFCIALAPVFSFKLFQGISLLQPNAGKRFYFALQVAHFFGLQGILDSGLIFGRGFTSARTRPRPCKSRSGQRQYDCVIQNSHFSPPTTERLTGNFTT